MAEEEHNLKKPTSSHLCTLNAEQMKQDTQTEVLLLKILSLTLSKISMEFSTLHTDIATDHMSPAIWPFSQYY